MKLFAFFMAFLVLALSVMPCADKGNSAFEGKAKTEVAKSAHPENDQPDDDCSPFCHCTCCAGFSLNHFTASVHLAPPRDAKPQPALLPSDTFEIVLPIWQPPQLLA